MSFWTAEAVEEALAERIPETRFRIYNFKGMNSPCTLLCPVHGEVHISYARNLMQNKYGCPTCGKDKSSEFRRGRRLDQTRPQMRAKFLRDLQRMVQDGASPTDVYFFVEAKINDIV